MEIFLVRHGETAWNQQRRLQGRTDIPLNDTGLAEARRAAKSLQDAAFDRIFTSPLQRARKTAETIRGSREIPITAEPLLTEVSFGIGEGICLHTVALGGGDSPSQASQDNAGVSQAPADPEEEKVRLAVLRFFRDPGHYEPVAGAESITEVKARALAFLDVLRSLEGSCECVLVTAHGGIIRAILDVIEGLPDEDFWHGTLLPNCGAAVVSLNGGKFRVDGTRELSRGLRDSLADIERDSR